MTAQRVDHIFARYPKINSLLAAIFDDPAMTRQVLQSSGPDGRVAWVDIAKGICIILVVMMHTTFGLEKATGEVGWMHAVVEFAKPFRMPDFFLISGLFLAATIDRSWRLYLDRKVVHFFYFYFLWVGIQFAFKAPFLVADGHAPGLILRTLLFTIVQPFGTLWFIYMLPVFFVITKLCRSWPWHLFAVAVVLQVLLAVINVANSATQWSGTLPVVATLAALSSVARVSHRKSRTVRVMWQRFVMWASGGPEERNAQERPSPTGSAAAAPKQYEFSDSQEEVQRCVPCHTPVVRCCG